MLYRKASKRINQWIKKGKKALLITGARQVGKTYLIEELLRSTNADFVKFDLLEQPEIVKMLEEVESQSIEILISRLTLFTEKKLTKGKTIIFIDEVQEYKEIVSKIKYLVQEGSFRYILSGSLLGVELTGLKSAPVGFMETIEMFPLDLEEYFISLNIDEHTMKNLKQSFNDREPIDPLIHEKLMTATYNYIVIGGMPEAVNTYVETRDYGEVMSVHQTIIPAYKLDFTKYELRERKLHLLNTYELIPAELNKKNKRYYFNHIDKNIKTDRYSDSFQWLIHAGVAIPTYNIDEPRLPLLASKKSNLFKLFLSDVGLLSNMYGRATVIETVSGNRNINYGALFENLIAQELRAHGYETYYFNSKKQGELDFIIEHENKCLPIEVKSGKDYTVHSALNNVLSNRQYDIKEGLVLCTDNLRTEGSITYLPLYMIMFIDEQSHQAPTLPFVQLNKA